MKNESSFDFFNNNISNTKSKEVISNKKEINISMILDLLIFSLALMLGINNQFGFYNIQDHLFAYNFMLILGYMGGSGLLKSLFEITMKRASCFVVLGGLGAYLISFLPIQQLLIPLTGVCVFTGIQVLGLRAFDSCIKLIKG